MTLGEWIRKGELKLKKAGVECVDPALHMRQIAGEGTGLSVAELPLHYTDELTSDTEVRVESILFRRLNGEPLQYIVRKACFWKEDFEVFPGVLIPRKETEHLVEACVSLIPQGAVKVGELGAGTGNIGISALKERSDVQWHAFELSPMAVDCAKANAERLLRGEKYKVHHGDFFSLAQWLAPFDWIISNPPYIARSVIPTLSPEVQREPMLALDGGESGLEVIRRLVRSARTLLVDGGGILFEIGYDQKQPVIELLQENGFTQIEVLSDYQGHPRVAFGRLEKDKAWMH